MFDVGFQEIVLIGVIALMVIGPERLPSVARSVGMWVGKAQRFIAGVKSDIASELKTDELRSLLTNQEDQIRELKEMVNETRSDLQKTAKSAADSMSKGMDGAVDQVRDAAETARLNNEKVEEIRRAAKATSTSSLTSDEKTDSADKTIDDQDSSKSA